MRGIGQGTLKYHFLPAPWKDGATSAQITVLIPPEYSPSGPRRYPVLYEAPYSFFHMQETMRIDAVLNGLIGNRKMPPVILVAISSSGGPYFDSECANSVDGLEWFDTYVAQTVVPFIDSHYRTIATPQARAMIGASQGGYCAAILALHHPDVFGSSLVFSAYYQAASEGGTQAAPFGYSKDAIDAASPFIVARQLDPAARANLYFVLVANLSQGMYGPQAKQFDQELTELGYPHDLVPSTTPHGWRQLAVEFPPVMSLWTARMVATGVFG